MSSKLINKHFLHGQSLVEYALLLLLVAVVVIGIVYGVGLAAQCIFGQISGTLGTRRDAQGQAQIVIEVAQCISVAPDPAYFQHQSRAERNADIVQRYQRGESSNALSREFGISDRRVRYLVARAAKTG
jgi:Flp pilus assembly pilin Flp